MKFHRLEISTASISLGALKYASISLPNFLQSCICDTPMRSNARTYRVFLKVAMQQPCVYTVCLRVLPGVHFRKYSSTTELHANSVYDKTSPRARYQVPHSFQGTLTISEVWKRRVGIVSLI